MRKKIIPNIFLNDQGWYTVDKVIDGVRFIDHFNSFDAATYRLLSLVKKSKSRRVAPSIYLSKDSTFTVIFALNKNGTSLIVSRDIRTLEGAFATLDAIKDSLH